MEKAFLRILSVVDDGVIDAAFNDKQEGETQSSVLSSPTDSSKTGNIKQLSQWGQYPLKTADDIKRWANVRWTETTKPPEEVNPNTVAVELEPEHRDVSEPGESAYDSCSRDGEMVSSPLVSPNPEDGHIELPLDFQEQFLW